MTCNCAEAKQKECGRTICCGRCPDRSSCTFITKCAKCAPDEAKNKEKK